MAVDNKITTSVGASSGTSTTVNKSADLGLIRNVVSDVLGARAKSIDYTASASAQREKALGYDAENAAYTHAADTADLYAVYTKATGDIAALQSRRQALKTIGTQQAQLASGGFSADTGSAVDQVKSSLQESYLADQLIRTQSRMEEGGYLEQAAASRAQFTASNEAKQQALNTAGVYDDAALQAKQQAINETAGLSGYLQSFAKASAGTVGNGGVSSSPNLVNGGGGAPNPYAKVSADDLLSGRDIGTRIALAPQIVEQSSTSSGVSLSTSKTTHSGSP